MASSEPLVLILDDDPSHLKIYSWIVEQAGCEALPVEVRSTSVKLPLGTAIDLVLMDYRYNSSLTAVDIVKAVKAAFPTAPIVVLSEVEVMPRDMKPHAVAFIRKGEPQELVNRLREFRETGNLRSPSD
jgi:DNA-binding NtrC family response regulator